MPPLTGEEFSLREGGTGLMLSDSPNDKWSRWWSFVQAYSAKRRYVPPSFCSSSLFIPASCCCSESSGEVRGVESEEEDDDDIYMDGLLQDVDVVMAKDSVCCTINANAIINMQHTTECTCEFESECARRVPCDLNSDNFIDWLVRFSKRICY